MEYLHEYLFIILPLIALLVWYISWKYFLTSFQSYTKKSDAHWDDYLTDYHVFKLVTFLIPIGIMYLGLMYFHEINATYQKMFFILVIVIFATIFMGIIKAFSQFYSDHKKDFKLPVKGYAQFFQLIILAITAVLIISIIRDISLFKTLSGLGAMSAILIFLFRDTFSSLISSIQLLTHNMARIGDWVEVKEFHAEGIIEDITLYNVKVRNWSNSVVNIPLSKFVGSTFINWQAIDDKQSRRMMRKIFIDIDTIHFTSDEEWSKWQHNTLIKDFIDDKFQSIKPHALSNIHLYKSYIEYYLSHHPDIYSQDEGFTFLVRLLESTPQGLPLQTYVYTKTKDWIRFEGIQADIFNHLLLIAKEFNLEHFQNISSSTRIAYSV